MTDFKKGDKVRIKPEFMSFYFKRPGFKLGKIACNPKGALKSGRIGFKRYGRKVCVVYVRVEHLEAVGES